MNELLKLIEQAKTFHCQHGYDECWQGCCYPGRCGRFYQTQLQAPTICVI